LLLAFLACASLAQSDITSLTGTAGRDGAATGSGLPESLPNLFSPRVFSATWQLQPVSALPKQMQEATKQHAKPRPRMQGSYTGYIDNAVVGTQIRVRFDADFSIQNPDRAEFFYGKCGCYEALPSNSSAYDPYAPGPGPGIAARIRAQEVRLNVEYAPVQRLSFFADVPERSVQYTSVLSGQISSATGVGDFETGFKFALIASPRTYVTFELGAFMPTGDASRGLGTNHFSIQPMLLFNHRLSDRVTIAGQFGDWHPIGGSAGVPTASPNGFAGDVLVYGLGSSYDFIPGSESHIAPVVEFVGWSVRGGFATSINGPVSASGTNIVNGKFGLRYSFQGHHSIYAGYGEALTNAHWYKELVRLEYRYVF
jgi:hypothetical protein